MAQNHRWIVSKTTQRSQPVVLQVPLTDNSCTLTELKEDRMSVSSLRKITHRGIRLHRLTTCGLKALSFRSEVVGISISLKQISYRLDKCKWWHKPTVWNFQTKLCKTEIETKEKKVTILTNKVINKNSNFHRWAKPRMTDQIARTQYHSKALLMVRIITKTYLWLQTTAQFNSQKHQQMLIPSSRGSR